MKGSAVPTPLNPSWWKLTSERTDRPSLPERAVTDITVIGGGITGLTTALMLKRAGRRVTVLEAGRVGEGITGYSTAKLTSLHALTYARLEAQAGEIATRNYAAANEWAITAIASLVEELAIDCQFRRRPAITYTLDPERTGLIDQEVDAARQAGLAAERIEASDLPFPIAAGIRLENQAGFHPLRYCLGLADAVQGDGSAVHEGSRVVDLEWKDDAGPVSVTVDGGGQVTATCVVLACGLPFLDRAGLFARMHPSRSYCLALKTRGELPTSMSISSGGATRSLHPVVGPDGEDVLVVAGEDHKVGQAGDTAERYARLEEFGRHHFRVEGVAARWSSQDYIPVDGIPLVGHLPMAHPQVYVATGFRKWGLTNGTAAARIITDLITERTNPWAGLFDTGRSQLPEGAGKGLKENLNVMKRFVGDRLRQATAPSTDELAPGSGGICRLERETVAAYRDDEGRLHLCSPVCTHMGCRVTWNAAEKSWDCPCHGSRFTTDGEVLIGPAVSPLERR